jgi:predicted GNAT family acetyltransferase
VARTVDDSVEINARLEAGKRDGAFTAEYEGRWIGELAVRRQDDGVLRLVHTGVIPEMRHRGIARRLVHAAVDYARANGIKVIPICTYAVHVFAEEPELADVLA